MYTMNHFSQWDGRNWIYAKLKDQKDVIYTDHGASLIIWNTHSNYRIWHPSRIDCLIQAFSNSVSVEEYHMPIISYAVMILDYVTSLLELPYYIMYILSFCL